MPLGDKIANGGKTVVVRPQPKRREVDIQALIYRAGIDNLRKQGREHNSLDILHVLLDTLNGLLPEAELAYKEIPSHTNAAAVNHLTNQLRECLADIAAREDFNARSALISDFVGQQYRQLMQSAVTDLFIAQKAIHMDPKKTEAEFDKVRNAFAKRFSESEKVVRAHITKLLTVKV